MVLYVLFLFCLIINIYLTQIIMEKDMEMTKDIKIYGKYLFCSSFCMLFSIIICYITNNFYNGLYYSILFLTSINFWRNPEYGLRRNIDKTVVFLGIPFTLSQLHLIKNEFYIYSLLSMCICLNVFYFIELILIKFNSNKWVIFHLTIHLYSALLILFILFE